MTLPFRRSVVAPILAALTTAAVFIAGLWIQQRRSAWPFIRPSAPLTLTTSGRHATASSSEADLRVPVDKASARALDIELETVSRQVLAQTIRTVATVVPDESRIAHVHTRIAGWVEHLDVNTTGEAVRAGQPLARIFSQELLSSQTEYLAARTYAVAAGITSAVISSGRTRLGVLGMTPAEIDAIEETGEPKKVLTVLAPQSGVVINRGVTVGTSVDPSTTLLTIANLERVWVVAEVPEADVPTVHVGTVVELDFPGSGRPAFTARVDFIYPTLSERTRTLRIRLSAPNPTGMLRPGLYGTAVFEATGQHVITVPRTAVIDTGLQQHVFVATGDRFEPRRVLVGAQLADRVEVREGLQVGEQVVASGVFLLDSESRLRATGDNAGHQHGASRTSQQSPPDANAHLHAGH